MKLCCQSNHFTEYKCREMERVYTSVINLSFEIPAIVNITTPLLQSMLLPMCSVLNSLRQVMQHQSALGKPHVAPDNTVCIIHVAMAVW